MYVRRSICLVVALLAGLAVRAEPRMEPKPYVAPRDETVSGRAKEAVLALLRDDWNALDSSTGVINTFMGETTSLRWYLQIGPPFPDTWPPAKAASFTYYAYAEYNQPLRHGPSLYVSGPWARVTYQDGVAARKEIVSHTIGPAISGRHSEPWSRQQADHYRAVQENQPAHISNLLTWTGLPMESDPSALPIRKLYCQWAFNHRALASKHIMVRHQAFFDWLSCDRLSLKDIGYLRGGETPVTLRRQEMP